MKRWLKILVAVCMSFVLSIAATGCGYRGYRGEYAAAYTLIYTQVPDIRGAKEDGPFLTHPQIVLVEKDAVGRSLYLYLEDTDEFLSIGIVQKETKDTVYFYPELSTLSFRIPDHLYDIDNNDIAKQDLLNLFHELCPNQRLDQFKIENDWDAPINENKLESAAIVTPKIPVRWEHRTDKVNLSRQKWEEWIFEVALKNGHEVSEENGRYFSHVNWMATDNYGRRLYYVEAYYYIYPSESAEENTHVTSIRYFLEMIAIIHPDQTFDRETAMVELVNKVDYQEQIRQLKLANEWNQP